MKPAEHLKVKKTNTIKEALNIIDAGAMHLALVVNEQNELIGTVSDGDIRRALLNGIGLDQKVSDIMSNNPIFIRLQDSDDVAIKKALEYKVYQLPVLDEKNKLAGIKDIEDFVARTKSNKVVLMVGGLGTRLKPLTDKVPKPMLHIGGVPILETILKQFKTHGFKEIILCVNYKAEIISDYFGDGKDFGLNITYIHENKRMGTAGSLSLIKDKLTEPFFVMNGDLLTNINFNHLMNYHLDFKSAATMCVREYDYQVPFGVVDVGRSSNIKSVIEKPVHKFFVSAGIYLCNPEVLQYIPDDTFYDMPTLFQEIIAAGKNAVSFPVREYWLDIGRIEEFKKANEEFSEVFGS